MRGFIITLATSGIILLLVLYSNTLRDSYRGMERALAEPQSLTYGAALFDDISAEVNSIAGPSVSFAEANDSLGVQITDTLPKSNYSAQLNAYEAFIEGTLANRTRTTIDANLSNLRTGTVTMRINQDYAYSAAPQGGEMSFTRSGGTNATAYYINISVVKSRVAYVPFTFNPSGDINVTVRYTDLNGTILASGAVLSSGTDFMQVTHDVGSVRVSFGRKSGNNGAVWTNATNVSASLSMLATLPPLNSSKRLGYSYDDTLSYQQGKVSIFRNLGK